MSSPGGSKLSASAALNAIKEAKKEAERKAAEAKAAAVAARNEANKPVDHAASGWWAASEAGQMNDEQGKKDAKATAGFASQYGLTGQSGMGSSLFSIQRASTDSAPPAAAASPTAASAVTAVAEAATEAATAAVNAAAATVDSAVSQLTDAINSQLHVAASSPAKGGAPAPGQEEKEAGWWSKMDNSTLNKEEDMVDKKAKQGFTPQLMGNSSLVNRLVPLGASISKGDA